VLLHQLRPSNGASNSWGESNSCGDLLASIGSFYYRTGQYHRAVSLYSRLKSTPSLKDRIDDVLLYPVVYSDYIINASKKYSIDPFLLLAIAREESRYNPEAISPAGAIGLLQIMPSTARRLSLEIKKDNGSVGGEVAVEAQRWPALLTDPALNIELGAFYLSRLIKRYGVLSYAIAAYNAGEAAVDSWLKNNYSDEDEFIEDIPYGETINYVKRVLTTYEKYLRIYRQMLPYQ
jgi:soluble lytic murein transglycosylase